MKKRNITTEKIYSKFDKEFFDPKRYYGFRTTKKLQKVKAIEIDLLKVFNEVCKKYGIKYMLWGGTLLGAIRHNGFIPWDDDIDVCLERKEFEKLIKVSKNEFRYPYFFQTYESDKKYFFGYARLRNSETTGIIKWNSDIEYNNGIYIDIFVMDGVAKNKIILKFQMLTLSFLYRIFDVYECDIHEKKGIKKIIYIIFKKTLCKVINKDVIACLFKKIITMNSNSDILSGITHGEKIVKRDWCYKKDFECIKYIDFYGIKVPIPIDYDRILKRCYGNYMEFPPLRERGKWHNGIIIFDPDVPYKKYMIKHKDKI